MEEMNKHKVSESLSLLAGILFLPAILAGCAKKAPDSNREEARQLFSKSIGLIKRYTDSISAARDSTSLFDLDNRFNTSLANLNFEYPSDTDLALSEGENDTLANVTMKYVAIRDSLLYAYAHPKADADSIATDSINE